MTIENASRFDPPANLPATVDGAPEGYQASPLPIRSPYPLDLVLGACPGIRNDARAGIGSARDLVDTACLVRSRLGISPDAWDKAREVMDDDGAAATISSVPPRAELIRPPGCDLRALNGRKKRGEFDPGPVLQALNRGRLGPNAGANQPRGPSPPQGSGTLSMARCRLRFPRGGSVVSALPFGSADDARTMTHAGLPSRPSRDWCAVPEPGLAVSLSARSGAQWGMTPVG